MILDKKILCTCLFNIKKGLAQELNLGGSNRIFCPNGDILSTCRLYI